MKILFQGEPGAFSNEASEKIKKNLNKKIDTIQGKIDFLSVWEEIENGNIGVLPIENGYAGSIHENLYYFLRYDYEIIGEYNHNINHCLLSLENNIKNIKKVYSHPQALNQCHNFLKENHIGADKFSDTAGAAKYLLENNIKNAGAIASKLSARLYNLNIIKENIQDQEGNTTKFFIISKKGSNISYNAKKGKISIIFEAKNIPASLYKCLGAFATNDVNLTKIESMPNLKNPFSYLFFITFEGNLQQNKIKKALEELDFFTNFIKVLGEY